MSHPTPDPREQPPGSPRDARAQAASEKAYRKATRPWYRKKRTWILGIIALLVLASCLGGLAGDTDDTTGTTGGDVGDAGTTADTNTAAPAAAFPGAQDDDVVGQAGDTLALGDTQVSSTPLTAGDATLGETLCTTATLVNNADEQVDFHMWDWELQAPSGTILTATVTGSDNILTGGAIAPGGTATGDVCFDADTSETGQYVVLYEPTFSFAADRGAWLNTR